MKETRSQIASLIDYALLQPTLTDQALIMGCEVARRYSVASVCVQPCQVEATARLLQGSPVMVSTVIAFPHGAQVTAIKVAEASLAIQHGASELDMVCNIGAVKSGNWDLVASDIAAVVETAAHSHVPVKVILEACYLTDDEKTKVCQLSESAGAAFVKTSTGFAPSGALVEDVRLMRSVVGQRLGVKASGGIRNLESLLTMVDAGATRIGASALTDIMAALPE
jgi:deoxyribose-phosphate aldolase